MSVKNDDCELYLAIRNRRYTFCRWVIIIMIFIQHTKTARHAFIQSAYTTKYPRKTHNTLQ